jgi:hypothetical protein
VTTGLTVPPHGGVVHHAIPEGFVVTLIPSGMHAPYQTVGELSYYMRAGSNFARTPHAVLSGMFGRRPQPSIKHSYMVSDAPERIGTGIARTQIGIVLKNFGRGIARDIFINLRLISHPGKNCTVEFQPSEEREVWWGRFALRTEMHLVTRAGFVLPPESYIIPLSLDIKLMAPIENDFSFEGICGSADGETWRFHHTSSVDDVTDAYEGFIAPVQFAGTPVGDANAQMAAANFQRKFYKSIETP